jgi:hypothetical protein
MYNIIKEFEKLPTLVQALIAALLSFFLNITVLILLFLGTVSLFSRIDTDKYQSVLGIRDSSAVTIFKEILK